MGVRFSVSRQFLRAQRDRRLRSTWWFCAAFAVVVVSACSGSDGTAPTTSPTPTSGSADEGGASPSDTDSAVAVDELVVPEIDFDDPGGSLIPLEVALRADDRERVGLVDLGPGALELATAMDAAAAAALAQVLADAAAESPVSTPTPSDASVPESSVEGLARHGAIADVVSFVPAPGFNAAQVWASLLNTLDFFANNPQSRSVEGTPETVRIGSNTGTVTTTVTVDAVVSGGRLSVDLTMRTTAQLVDGATGAVLYGIDSTASGHVDVDFCPDASGHAQAHVSLTSNETYSQGGGSGTGTTREMSAEVGVTVGDDANIVAVEGTLEGSDATRGVPPSGGGAPLAPTTRTASDNIANDGSGRRLPGVARDIRLGGEGTTSDEQTAMFGTTNVFMETAIAAATKEAEKLWKSGKCVELLVDPEGGDVQPDEVTSVTAKLRPKIEGNELDKPIEATLTGVESLDPAGEKQPAPATVSYTAGHEDGDFGEIVFRSVSNRGIAEKSVRFTVRRAAWNVTFTGTDTEAFGPLINRFTAEITDLRITADDDVLSGTGELRLTGDATISAPGAVDCTGPLDQTGTIVATGTLVGSGSEARLHVTLRATSPLGESVHVVCTGVGGGMELDLPAEGYLDRFGEPLAEFDLPAAGGSVAVSTTTAVGGIVDVTVDGTFVVTAG